MDPFWSLARVNNNVCCHIGPDAIRFLKISCNCQSQMSFMNTYFRTSARATAAKNMGFARLPLLLGVAVLVFAIALYSYLGSPGMTSSTSHTSTASMGSGAGQPGTSKVEGVPSVASLVSGLEERLANAPDDAKGWLLLAKTYQHLGRIDDARAALDKAVALGQSDTEFEELLDNASTATASAASVAEIRGRVSLTEAAQALVGVDDSVFIFAKAVGGQPAPLAVIRRSVADLPFEFVLSDAQAMVQGNELSGAESVIVTAKISAPQDALRSVAGLEVSSEPVASIGAAHLELIIGSPE